MKKIDLIHYIVTETLARQMPGASREQIEEAAKPMLQPMHDMFGGDRYYIPEQSPRLVDEKREAVVKDALGADPNEAIQRRHGISRRTLYRIIKR
jgi:Mor family transcriptional regulator